MSPILLLLIILLLLFGGGGSYWYTRRPGYTGGMAPDWLYIFLVIIVIGLLLRAVGVV